MAQTGTVSAAEDDDTVNDSATLTADPSGGGYGDLADGTLPVTVTDDDAAGAGMTMAPASLTIAEGESGTFTVVLVAVPTGTVTVAVSSDHDEVTIDPASLTFTTSNWNVAQTGTVSAAEDDDATNDSATLTADSSGGGYGDVADGTLPVTVTDDDVSGAEMMMEPESLTIAEGESETFTVALAVAPMGTVTVAVSSDHDGVTIDPASLTFTTVNWNVAQTGTVSTVEDDDAADENVTLTADPSGGGYGDLADGALPVTVTDEDATDEETAWEKKVVEEVLANVSLGLLRSARDVLRQRVEAEPESGFGDGLLQRVTRPGDGFGRFGRDVGGVGRQPLHAGIGRGVGPGVRLDDMGTGQLSSTSRVKVAAIPIMKSNCRRPGWVSTVTLVMMCWAA